MLIRDCNITCCVCASTDNPVIGSTNGDLAPSQLVGGGGRGGGIGVDRMRDLAKTDSSLGREESGWLRAWDVN